MTHRPARYPAIIDRIRTWVILGFAVGCLYVMYVLVLYGLRGAATFDRVGVRLPALVVAYLGCGMAGGAIIGALQPLTRQTFGLFFVAMVAAFAVVSGVGMSMYGFVTRWSNENWLQMLISAVLIGGFSAVLLRAVRTGEKD